jgi:hypothetical protein
MNAGKVVALVFGSLFLLIGIVLLIGGGTLVGVDLGFKDDEGFLNSPEAELSHDGYAIAAPVLLEDEWIWWWRHPTRAQVRMEGDEAIFLGLGERDDVEAFLAGVSHAEIRDLDFDEFRETRVWAAEFREFVGPNAPQTPSTQAFWAASAEGDGVQTLRWEVEAGDWLLVAMNADGSRGIELDGTVGVEAPWLLGLGIGLLAAGLVVAAIGLALVLVVARSSRAAPPREEETSHVPPSGHPLTLKAEKTEPLSPVLWLVKWFLLIPHFLVLPFLLCGFCVSWLLALFAILFTGRYPRGLFDYNVGVMRWCWRVAYYGYEALGTDRYPPFTLRAGGHPADLDVRYPERLSHGLVLVKWWLLAIPHYVVVGIFQGGAGFYQCGLVAILTFFAAITLLFTGRYPEDLFRLIVGLNRWTFRLWAYVALMTDEYPPFRLEV